MKKHFINVPSLTILVLSLFCSFDSYACGAVVSAAPTAPIPDTHRAKPGSCETAGDPVVCSSGSFTYHHNDLHIDDVIPIDIERVYTTGLVADDVKLQQGNNPNNVTLSSDVSTLWQRSFGINFFSNYHLFISISESTGLPRLTLPSGSQIYYKAVSGSTNTWNNHDAPSAFLGSTIALVSSVPYVYRSATTNMWYYLFQGTTDTYQLTLKTGESYTFKTLGNAAGSAITGGIYDTEASLVAFTNRTGQSLTFTYDSLNRLQQVTSPSGHWVQFSYGLSDVLGRATAYPTAIRDDSGRVVSYQYGMSIPSPIDPHYLDPHSEYTLYQDYYLTQVTFADGTTNQYFYAAASGGAPSTSYVVNTVNPSYLISDPNAYIQSGVFIAANSQTVLPLKSIIDGRGNNVLWVGYDDNGRVFKELTPNGGAFVYFYSTDSKNNVTSTTVVDRRGSIRTIVFNASGYSTSDVLDVGDSIQQSYSYVRDAQTNQITSVLDPLGRTTTLTYDALGNVTNKSVSDGTHTSSYSFTYTAAFNALSSLTDPLGHSTTFAYDTLGNLTTVTQADGISTNIAYNSYGLPTSVKDGLGNVSTLSYAGAYLTTIADAVGRARTLGRDSLGRIVSVTDSLGHQSTASYDVMDRLTSRTDANGNLVSYSYDANGKLTKFTRPLGGTTTYSYDASNNLISRADPLGNSESFGYDVANNLVQHVDRNGTVSYFAYDLLNRPVTAAYGVIAGTSYYQTVQAQQQAIIGELNDIQLMPNSGSVGGPEASAYFSALQYIQGVENAIPALVATLPAESTVTTIFDAGNRPTQIKDSAAGTIAHSYDYLDDLTGETTPLGSVSYTYDIAGRRLAMSSAGGESLAYSYDAANRLLSFGSGQDTVGYVYDAAGRITKAQLPNSVIENFYYDASGEITNLYYSLQNGSPIGNISYSYDQAGRRVGVGGSLAATAMPAVPNTTSSYNLADQLVNTVSSASSPTVAGFPSVLSSNVSYDKNGNLKSDGTYTYFWDARDRLRQSTLLPTSIASSIVPSTNSVTGYGAMASFTYDAFNRRQTKVLWGNETGFLYNGANNIQELSLSPAFNPLISSASPGTGISSSYYRLTGPGIDDVLSRVSSTSLARSTVLKDAQNSVVGLVDPTGTLTTQYYYGPYGAAASVGTSSTSFPYIGNSDSNELQYTGRENDGTGLYYYRARYYSPSQQRFISEDPSGLVGGSNFYAYVGGNPISFTDPMGLWRFPDYVTFQLDAYVFSVSATYTVYGDIFLGKGVSRPYPNPLSSGVSIADGWMRGCGDQTPSRKHLNDFLNEYSVGGGGYVLVGGSYATNSSGSAINAGVGAGGFSGNVIYNTYQGNIFGE